MEQALTCLYEDSVWLAIQKGVNTGPVQQLLKLKKNAGA